ncbi:HlyD family secretion protein [Planctomyces sp. SH-PL62]|uniref:HlyD family secretion protein n=1 Tax=Planctomyces sp. SH-PL62 TaxID=1636152 RepID=UPI00078CF5D6|nr:HlyD family secretion protein [Planctomyces sp. SH-PL62]AMV40791.1 Multidrug export protein EmrA [Planctomyces sp. SH-PL62]
MSQDQPRPADGDEASDSAQTAVEDDRGEVSASEEDAGPPHRWPWRRERVFWLAAALPALAVGAWWAWPRAVEWATTVSTDDAYVDGHVTLVGPRVQGQVVRVLVDDNDRVGKGDLLAELDREPYQARVDLERSRVGAAEADLRAAESEVRGAMALARAQRWELQSAMEGVDNRAAELRSQVAALRSREATRDLARVEFGRTEQLMIRNAASRSEYDAATAQIKVAEAQVLQAAEQVRELRVGLGLPPDAPEGGGLQDVPADLNQTFSGVRRALADLIQTMARLGLPLASHEATPAEFLEEFRKHDAQGDVDKIFAGLLPEAPAVKQAQAKLEEARRTLALAELDLGYCEIRAEIDGVIARRNVNPGNHVVVGERMMAVRSLDQIWVDCHFKETQLSRIRIGHPVDLWVDAYPGRPFRGRVSGFAPGTGAALAVLPPENATGNFVKVVQRLTVRVELVDLDPRQAPLAAGLSVVPVVRVREAPTGPDAGARLRTGGGL